MCCRARSSTPRELSNVTDLVAEAEDQVRAVMARTRPPALRDGDLAQAVIALRDDMEQRYGLMVDVEWPESPYPLPLVTAVTLYRFFQESLLNVIKHADVDDAFLSLTVDEHAVVASWPTRVPASIPIRCGPSAVGTSVLACCANVSGWPAAHSMSRRGLARAPR